MKKLWNWCMEMYQKYKEIVNYLIVGGLTTVIALAVYYITLATFLDPDSAIQLQIANILSWTSGVLFAYVTNRKFVFESKSDKKIKEFTNFVSARIVTLLIDMGFMWFTVTVLQWSYVIMKLVSQVITTILNYVFGKFFVFKKAKDNTTENPT